MTPFQFFSQSKSKWLAAQEVKLHQEFAPQLAALRQDYQHQVDAARQEVEQLRGKSQQVSVLQAKVDEAEEVLAIRKVRVEEANAHLRTQLQLLEAQAAPDRVWVEAFSRGYEKAWDTMWPLMAEGVKKLEAAIEQRAIDATLHRLDVMIVEKAKALGIVRALDVQTLQAKREEFRQKQATAHVVEDRMRYTHYLTALDWMLDANGVHPHQPVSQ